MKLPFLFFDLGPHDSYKDPYEPGAFVGNREIFDKYLEDHEKESNTGELEKPDNKFPRCCQFHKFILDDVQNWFDNFPNDDDDKEYLKNPRVDISEYAGLPLKITVSILLSQYHIEKTINTPDWYNDNTDYIEYIVGSFGYPAIGYGYYLHYLKHLLQNLEGSETEKEAHKKLLGYIEDHYYTPKEKVELPDFNRLYETYTKWLAVFPFNISYFIDLKNGFEKSFFAFLLKNRKDNRYTNTYTAKARTQIELLEILTLTTKELLIKIDAADLLEKGQITDTKKHTLELKKNDLKIKNDLLLGKFSNGEIEYLNILKEWLAYQKDFFRDIALFITDEPVTKSEDQTPEKLRAKFLKTEFEKIGFSNLPMIKGRLSDKNIESLFELLSNKKTPYQVAMLNYLGVLDFLFNNNTKEKSYKILATILKAKDRVVKGNCLVLSDQSNEDRQIYTSFIHKQEVEKDYQKLKLG